MCPWELHFTWDTKISEMSKSEAHVEEGTTGMWWRDA
jgi:hypothetical protein